jgi:hypothetical protein
MSKNGKIPIEKTLVRCFPLYSIIMAIGNPLVDLFSLDIEVKLKVRLGLGRLGEVR